MSEMKDCLVRSIDGGKILISAEVLAAVAALAVREVDGVYALSMTPSLDLAALLSGKNLRKGISVVMRGEEICVSCNLVVLIGRSVMTVAKNVQDVIADEIESVSGIRPVQVNVNVCGIVAPKKK